MNYQESMNYLLERLPMFQRVGKAALKKDLTNTIKMLDRLDNPQNTFRSIHIAGTNGKGTSAHALTSILMSAGYKTGLYTSPHLKSFTERIRINGVEVTEEFVADFTTQNRPMIEEIQPSFFEATVVMAFDYFRQQQVDVAVIETGLGGRLDSTNVITPEAALITMIGYDHMDLLGDTLEQIASEKAGIIKPNVPVVVGNNQRDIRHVFEEVARSKKAPFHHADQIEVRSSTQSIQECSYIIKDQGKVVFTALKTDLTAAYFALNIPGILKTVEVLNQQYFAINKEAIHAGFKNIKGSTGLKGRLQILQEKPLVIADISHNQPGLIALFEQLLGDLNGKLHVIFGVVRDKDLSRIFSVLPKDATYYWTQSGVPRSLPVQELKVLGEEHGILADCFDDVNKALAAALNAASSDDIVVVCGSTFVVAEIDKL